MEPEVDADGTKRWRDERGQPHRDDGPAIEFANGTCYWYWRGQLHRDGGPAIVHADGNCWWYQHGQPHRDDGPAIVHAYGACHWYWYGVQHRGDGPAMEFADGTGYWYWYGRFMLEAGHAAVRRRTSLAVLALDAARRRKRRAVHLPAELWNALAEW